MRETTEPHDVAQKAQIAPDSQSLPLSSTTNAAANCLSGAGLSTPVVSPLFESTFLNGSQFDLDLNVSYRQKL